MYNKNKQERIPRPPALIVHHYHILVTIKNINIVHSHPDQEPITCHTHHLKKQPSPTNQLSSNTPRTIVTTPHPILTFSYHLLPHITIVTTVTNKHFTSPPQLFLIISFYNRHNCLNHSNSILHNNDNTSHFSYQYLSHLSQPSQSTISHPTLTFSSHLLPQVTTVTIIAIQSHPIHLFIVKHQKCKIISLSQVTTVTII